MESLTTSSEPSSSSSSWRILEFYSGIGGMRYSLKRAMGGRGVVVEAFEINDIANDVYEFNFSHRPYQGNIHSLTPAELDKYRADAWLLSPPCQPYTRQGLRKDSADARASSFIKLLQAISSMQHPPLVMFVENVVGFEVCMHMLVLMIVWTSDTHRQLMEVLDANDFVTQEFILSPMQFDVPYSRPRYFCLAKRKPLSFINPSLNGQLLHTPPTGTCKSDTLIDQQPNVRWEEPGLSCSPIKKFLQSGCSSTGSVEDEEFLPGKPTDHNKDCKNNQHGSSADVSVLEVGRDGLVPNSQVSVWASGNNHLTSMNGYAVPLRLIERWGSAMDVVFPDSKRCCCFTKSYYRYVKGTGSLLATAQVVEKSELVCLENLGLRYFTPREVANFHSFPEDFDFPLHITKKQRYALLGNSLSVAVVAPLLQYLFVESTQLLS